MRKSVMRDTQFRGKANDRWYYGHYLKTHDVTYCMASDIQEEDNTHHFILFDRMTDWNLPNNHYKVEVDGNTVGEWSGMYDKNHKPIYEGDIVRKRTKLGIKNCRVVFRDGAFICGYGGGSSTPTHPYLLNDKYIEVIGNVFDNPELLQK